MYWTDIWYDEIGIDMIKLIKQWFWYKHMKSSQNMKT
jgi:hypothetical protein